ncbi:hypothetical protein [Maridesulfovibrio frigidus]|uniref:hypothetical protein n=1 Tax=Maridesulfovibrio frigidus TaxID=340956 RepID=UPI0012EB3D62|nr:hypothetical protein [Maridesulfovibrio frigidus]
MSHLGESKAEEKSGKNVNSVSMQGGMGKSREPEVDSADVSNNELNALRNAATRSTTGQDDFKGKPVATSTGRPNNSTAEGENLTSFDVTPPEIALNGEGQPIMMCSQKGTMVPVSPGEQAAAIRRASERDAKRLADGDVEDTYGARVAVALSGLGFKGSLGFGVHFIDKDHAVLVRESEGGVSNIMGAGLEGSIVQSNAEKPEDFEGVSNYAGVSVSPTLKGVSIGLTKSSNGKAHSTALTFGGSVKTKLIQPFETTAGRTSSTVEGVFDPTPEVLEKIYSWFD